jgi:hypothetical protein
MIINSRIVYSVLFYSLVIILIVVSRPPLIFDYDGSIKPFGVASDHTMISFGVIAVVLAILSFYVFCLIDLIFATKKAI